MFGVLDPLPPYPNFALTYSIEFRQPPLLHLLLAQPPSPLSVECGRHMYNAPYSDHHALKRGRKGGRAEAKGALKGQGPSPFLSF